MKKDINDILISPESSVLDAVRTIDRGAMQIALVVDGHGRLKGTVTDGDVRRGVLRGVKFDEPVSAVMNADAVSVPVKRRAQRCVRTDA